jgi:carbonic anhydrase
MPPARKLAIVACMDARLTVEQALGLKTGEAHIIRSPNLAYRNGPAFSATVVDGPMGSQD